MAALRPVRRSHEPVLDLRVPALALAIGLRGQRAGWGQHGRLHGELSRPHSRPPLGPSCPTRTL